MTECECAFGQPGNSRLIYQIGNDTGVSGTWSHPAAKEGYCYDIQRDALQSQVASGLGLYCLLWLFGGEWLIDWHGHGWTRW